jgi:hypothetical protein
MRNIIYIPKSSKAQVWHREDTEVIMFPDEWMPKGMRLMHHPSTLIYTDTGDLYREGDQGNPKLNYHATKAVTAQSRMLLSPKDYLDAPLEDKIKISFEQIKHNMGYLYYFSESHDVMIARGYKKLK